MQAKTSPSLDRGLGFWGWPTQLEDSAAHACRAALSIHEAFCQANQDPQHLLHGFQIGIGIAHGIAVAGRIGAQEQIKVDVFGPVVNLASRLQDLTKAVGVPILIDEATAITAGQTLAANEGYCRRVGRLRPAGVQVPVDAYALIPSQDSELSLTGEQLRAHDAAVEAIIGNSWAEAKQLLQQLPLTDGPANFLRNAMANLGEAPADWDGAINMGDKKGQRLMARGGE